MKRNIFRIALMVLPLALLLLTSCSRTPSDRIYLTLKVEGDVPKTLYLYSVIDEGYGYYQIVDTLVLEDGELKNAPLTILPQLCLISPFGPDQYAEVSRGANQAFLFLVKGENDFILQQHDGGTLEVTGKANPVHEQWRTYCKERDEMIRATLMDSLTTAFYTARDAGDSLGMASVNAQIETVQQEIDEKYPYWMQRQQDTYGKGIMGIYLFFTNEFSFRAFTTRGEIDSMQTLLKGFDAQAQESDYATRIAQSLEQMARSVIGANAPNIVGQDSTGTVVELAQLKGKWVLVDFWASGCGWCRKETPFLKAAWDKYRDKNFVLLGVSSDRNREDWLGAIHEDGADWHHILLNEAQHARVQEDYYIVGIPQILLVSPEGVIVHRDLRGEAIEKSLAEALQSEAAPGEGK